MVNFMAKNILGTSGGGSSLLGTAASSNQLTNVHLQYTSPNVGLDHTILTARTRHTGGSFGLDIEGYLVYMEAGLVSTSRIQLSLVYITSGYQLLGFQMEDDSKLRLRNVVRGVECYIPAEAGNVSYSLAFTARPVIGVLDPLDYANLPGRVVTKLQ